MNRGITWVWLAALAVTPLAPAHAEETTTEEQPQFGPLAEAPKRPLAGRDVEPGALFSGLGVGMFLATSGDAVSTEWGLSRPGVYEANPLMRNRAVRIGAHVAVPTLMWWASDHFYKNGQRKVAWALRIGMTAAYGYVTLHNVRKVSKVQ